MNIAGRYRMVIVRVYSKRCWVSSINKQSNANILRLIPAIDTAFCQSLINIHCCTHLLPSSRMQINQIMKRHPIHVSATLAFGLYFWEFVPPYVAA